MFLNIPSRGFGDVRGLASDGDAGRGAAAAARWTFHGDDDSWRRCGRELDIPRRRVDAAAATSDFRRNETTSIVRGDESRRLGLDGLHAPPRAAATLTRIAAAAVHGPSIVLVEDPFRGLDAAGCVFVARGLAAERRSCPLVLILLHTSRGRRPHSDAAKMSGNGARTAERRVVCPQASRRCPREARRSSRA